MEKSLMKGDGKITLSFKDNQCLVETEYAPPPPPPLSREPQLPFNQTILAGSLQSQPWLTGLIILQAITMIIGVVIMVGIGVYLVSRSQDTFQQQLKTQAQLESQEGTISGLQMELKRLSRELKSYQEAEKKPGEVEKVESETNPKIETNPVP